MARRSPVKSWKDATAELKKKYVDVEGSASENSDDDSSDEDYSYSGTPVSSSDSASEASDSDEPESESEEEDAIESESEEEEIVDENGSTVHAWVGLTEDVSNINTMLRRAKLPVIDPLDLAALVNKKGGKRQLEVAADKRGWFFYVVERV